MEIKKLTNEEVELNLKRLKNWSLVNSKLHKLFKFKNFKEAINFMVNVGVECEKMDHHPEWSNVYGNVDVKLITHSVAGITELDFLLAEHMDRIARISIL